MNIDTEILKRQNPLPEYVGGRVQGLRRITAAGELAGACPKCGGRDRFHVSTRFWFCRQCHPLDSPKPAHDVIGFVQWIDGKNFRDACLTLGEPTPPRLQNTPPKRTQTPKRANAPKRLQIAENEFFGLEHGKPVISPLLARFCPVWVCWAIMTAHPPIYSNIPEIIHLAPSPARPIAYDDIAEISNDRNAYWLMAACAIREGRHGRDWAMRTPLDWLAWAALCDPARRYALIAATAEMPAVFDSYQWALLAIEQANRPQPRVLLDWVKNEFGNDVIITERKTVF